MEDNRLAITIARILLGLPFVALIIAYIAMSGDAVEVYLIPNGLKVLSVWLMGIPPMAFILGFAFGKRFDKARPGDSAMVFLTIGLAWPILIYYYLATQIANFIVKVRADRRK